MGVAQLENIILERQFKDEMNVIMLLMARQDNTIGSGCKDGSQTGFIPQAMNALFNKIKSLKHQIEF
ncbi:hypothetical protein L1987_59513 [Smallanthus sonchifolius]|uniref:Uncharacterized protein n=1 Tax=Smallanthus sonchifolius TaxID=185202 RepID=A0ACB9D5R0_9ASTR|nr:hypothetical protein L1987_59513 [Smallanthus sonchifolius]